MPKVDWKAIAKKAWTMWLVYLGFTVQAAEYFFPYVADYLPRKWWLVLLLAIGIARLVKQKGLSLPDDPA